LETLTLQPPLLGESRAIDHLRDFIVSVSLRKEPVLLTGPGGTGKSLAAGKIHAIGPRAASPCCVLDAGAFSGDPLEAAGRALGGNGRPGTILVRNAEELGPDRLGTILADPVGSAETPRWILTSRFVPESTVWQDSGMAVSCSEPGIQPNVRWHRLAIPALADRREDIPVICRYQVWLHSLPDEFDERWHWFEHSVLPRLLTREWPDNVRELIQCVERVCGAGEGTPARWSGAEGRASAQEEYIRQEFESALEEVRALLAEEAITGKSWILPHPGRSIEEREER